MRPGHDVVEVVFSAEKARERGWRKKDTRVNSPRMFKGEDKVTTCTTSVSLTFGISKREMKTKKRKQRELQRESAWTMLKRTEWPGRRQAKRPMAEDRQEKR